jgi:DNA-binding transcriptional MerR regulator
MLSSDQVCKLVGISYRQLDYWSRTGLIEGQEDAGGSGRRRRWTPVQVERVRALQLVQKLRTLPYAEVVKLLDQMRAPAIEQGPEMPNELDE